MKVMAILQNMWFKDPARMRRQLETTFKGDRQRFIKTWLFFGCLTGRRLQRAFGEQQCDEILWEEASPVIGGHSSSVFPADTLHIAQSILLHQPAVIMTFGKIARVGLLAAAPMLDRLDYIPPTLSGPHPAARHASVCDELRNMALALMALQRKDLPCPATPASSPPSEPAPTSKK